MSRVGRSPIAIPKGVTVTVKDGLVTAKGPKGELKLNINPNFQVENNDGKLEVKRPSEERQDRSLHGLYRALINNMTVGVSEGFQENLLLVGVGYRAEAKGNQLDLSLGFSHQIVMMLPKEVSVETESVKGMPPKIMLKSIDKQLLGQVAAKIRSLRPPEPYKGKGVKYETEIIRRKAGKSSGKGKK